MPTGTANGQLSPFSSCAFLVKPRRERSDSVFARKFTHASTCCCDRKQKWKYFRFGVSESSAFSFVGYFGTKPLHDIPEGRQLEKVRV